MTGPALTRALQARLDKARHEAQGAAHRADLLGSQLAAAEGRLRVFQRCVAQAQVEEVHGPDEWREDAATHSLHRASQRGFGLVGASAATQTDRLRISLLDAASQTSNLTAHCDRATTPVKHEPKMAVVRLRSRRRRGCVLGDGLTALGLQVLEPRVLRSLANLVPACHAQIAGGRRMQSETPTPRSCAHAIGVYCKPDLVRVTCAQVASEVEIPPTQLHSLALADLNVAADAASRALQNSLQLASTGGDRAAAAGADAIAAHTPAEARCFSSSMLCSTQLAEEEVVSLRAELERTERQLRARDDSLAAPERMRQQRELGDTRHALALSQREAAILQSLLDDLTQRVAAREREGRASQFDAGTGSPRGAVTPCCHDACVGSSGTIFRVRGQDLRMVACALSCVDLVM